MTALEQPVGSWEVNFERAGFTTPRHCPLALQYLKKIVRPCLASFVDVVEPDDVIFPKIAPRLYLDNV